TFMDNYDDFSGMRS
ncbi:MAG: hypothetical protein EZS28_032818, partial [Streblomastix strix]